MAEARRRDSFRPPAGVWSGLALLYLFIPIFIVVLFSFNDNKGRFNFTWAGFTLGAGRIRSPTRTSATALKNSLRDRAGLDADRGGARARSWRWRSCATGSAARRCRHLRVPAARDARGRARRRAARAVPDPERQTGIVTIVIAHVMFTVSYVVVTVKARLEGMDRHIEEAAHGPGADEWTTFRKVTLPLIAPGVAAAGLLAFAMSIDDYVITRFNAGQTQTFPLFISAATRQGVPAEVNVLGVAAADRRAHADRGERVRPAEARRRDAARAMADPHTAELPA